MFRLGIRQFHSSRAFRAVHFDTRKFMVQLQNEGFTSEQSEGVVKIVSQALADGVNSIGSTLVTKETLSKMTYQQKVDFAKLRGELQTIDRSEFQNIENENERIRNDLEKLRTRIREEITKANAGVKLDLNLEKGRIREEGSQHESHISEINTRIDQEVANMKMQIDGVKTQVMQWLIGVCTGTFALVLAYVRLLT
ncbi:Coiled-coil domain-containing protein [Wickerhamomyces ciferrii]|uniref:Coiled-coil domain-containing protein n=1 Tax=Wickerhamomyces ciferrii (strain ATCC 14091 / BCRC 22168 / CBS 111 / JCM 3599 / NBRC 0793 / NRRL Y-1031 F-60-10) TaxID=1206466 RepID=K0KBM4_WICCF|nr:Coiled-coil domain-containing protein [Wickerhamomyces ciferrii]CCH42445.1 Coiled-coil domain-containing protein [Wickerhamomyces ciferrii]